MQALVYFWKRKLYMKYNALRAPCDAKVTLTSDIPTLRDKKTGGCASSCAFGSQGGGSVAFCFKVCDFLAQQDEFLLHCDHVWSFVKSATNVTCLEFLQFFQISLAASTNWRLKLNFYSISDNKYNKFDSFLKKQKPGSFGVKTRGRKRFPAKTEGWNLCDIELPRQMFNSVFVVDVCLYVFSTCFLCCSILFFWIDIVMVEKTGD